MAKRGYKLQELVAHSDNVNCVSIGKKAGRLFITGGDDNQVRVWSVGKPTSLMSLCGLTSPVESLAFDSAEILVAAGASTGMIKLWDLEEAKVVRTLTGHKANCSAVEFHPFGEFFASGSLDTHLKIWDIRKKGCMHTYKGHSQGIGIIRFSPDGRWIVSGGLDNSVKIWDLTAGKLLHDFKSHDGHIRAIDFHPLEFLLATGSADKTVKFWDLETFELIGASRPETTGVRAMTFHPDGRTLFCGLEDSFKVYSWEPIIRHDSVDMGWSTLGDLCIHDDKLLGCSVYSNSVGVWAADISLIEPYRASVISEHNVHSRPKSAPESKILGKQETETPSSLRSRNGSPDSGTREKTIYVDVVSCEHSEGLKKIDLRNNLVSSESKCYDDVKKHSRAAGLLPKASGQPVNKSLVVPSIVPREGSEEKKNSVVAENVSTMTASGCPENGGIDEGAKEHTAIKVVRGVAVVPGRTRSLVEKFERHDVNSSTDLAIQMPPDQIPESDKKTVASSQVGREGPTQDTLSRKDSSSQELTGLDSAKKLIQDISRPHLQGTDAPLCLSKKELMHARECERDLLHGKETQPQILERVSLSPPKSESLTPQMSEKEMSTPEVSENESLTPQVSESESSASQASEREPLQPEISGRNSLQPQFSERQSPEPQLHSRQSPKLRGEAPQTRISRRGSPQLQAPRRDSSQVSGREPSRPYRIRRESPIPLASRRESSLQHISQGDTRRESSASQFSGRESSLPLKARRESSISQVPRRESSLPQISRRELFQPNRSANFVTQTLISDSVLVKSRATRKDCAPPQLSEVEWRDAQVEGMLRVKTAQSGMDGDLTLIDGEMTNLQISERDPQALSDKNFEEAFMQDHDIFLTTLRSRLTKLQVVRHFWERNDIKGAVNALKRLPDQSVQADVVSVLSEKMEILNLDLFSCLLPVLVELLDSTIERHLTVSLELLVKLVAVFGPIIFATASGPPSVGVDLHAEERREWCNLCFTQLQKIQQRLPPLIKRGGAVARPAQELNLVLQAA